MFGWIDHTWKSADGKEIKQNSAGTWIYASVQDGLVPELVDTYDLYVYEDEWGNRKFDSAHKSRRAALKRADEICAVIRDETKYMNWSAV